VSMKYDRESLQMPIHLTGDCSTAFLECMFGCITMTERDNEACLCIHSSCMHPAHMCASGHRKPSHEATLDGCLMHICMHMYMHRLRPLTRPTKLIDAGLACLIPCSLVTSAKHVSS
jgi:hypothetical protein